MNFQPTDYLNDWIVDFDENLGGGEQTSPEDLDLFSKSEFVDLEAFGKKGGNLIKDYSTLNGFSSPERQDYSQVVTPAVSSNFMSDTSIETPSIVPQNVSAEDKRKRNTAASARFRIKKKMKEQQMSEKSKELEEKVVNLERKLKSLETENKCLRELVLKRNQKKSLDLLESIKKKSQNSQLSYDI